MKDEDSQDASETSSLLSARVSTAAVEASMPSSRKNRKDAKELARMRFDAYTRCLLQIKRG